ncbi:MAG: putative polysaccharide biosynthesis protein [Actinomycetia bacterium]|nr:putative polysaccharide biosynthesis protein [Actinomycetes bacterium]
MTAEVREPGFHAFLGRHRGGIQLGVDVTSWCMALFVVLCIRYDFANGWSEFARLARFVPVVVASQMAIGAFVGLYQGRWRFGSFDEVAALAITATATGALVEAIDAFYLDRLVPLSIPVGAAFFALVGMAGTRYTWRLFTDRNRRPDPEVARRLLVLGAGDTAAQLVSALQRDPDSPYRPVALLDDDPGKANLRIVGVPVVGRLDELAEVAVEVGAEVVLLAIPTAPAELVRRLTEVCTRARVDLRVVPPMRELVGHAPAVRDIRPPTEADLLGRREIDTDVASIAGYLTGKRVLITGAGGSIGAELCRQVTRFGPRELVMVDRDESALHAIQLSLEGRALLDRPNLVVADIRDEPRVREIFARWRPEVVFHAAALKHLPLLELHPDEAVKTNVYGTEHLLAAALAHDVARFVNISTDKAADPCSVLGYSKRVAERLTARAAASASAGVYLSVRFGNVLGSRGSMLGTFRAQIAAGGPITVTHPEVTRYFMTIEEAVQLVIQAGAIGRTGEALVLDMGEPVRIADVASQLAGLAARPIEIVFTGLRPGEKLHEVLWADAEVDERPIHPMISHVVVDPLPEHALETLAAVGGELTRLALADACGVDDLGATIDLRPEVTRSVEPDTLR